MPGDVPSFRSPHSGREKLDAGLSIPRHRHEHGYVAVVLSGGYQEAGLSGRYNLTAGDVAVHRPFDSHLDHVGTTGAAVVNLPLPSGSCLPAMFRIEDPDAIARMAERDPLDAARSLVPTGVASRASDWPDELARFVSGAEPSALKDWAAAKTLAPETLSRGFRKAYGVAPARFRAEARAYRALHLIRESGTPLAAIAADCGFADQPHLTRAIVRLTGHAPGYWRRSIPFKTAQSKRR